MSVPETAHIIAIAEQAMSGRPRALSWDDQFAALVQTHSRFVFQVAYAVLRNVHDAEDAVQETFLKLYRRRRWDAVANERAFFARAAWRVALDRLPKRAAQTPGPDLPARGASPEQQAIDADRAALVARLIDALPEDLRQPLALSTVDEMTSEQIAAVMNIPESTVRGRLLRARHILKEKLAAYGN